MNYGKINVKMVVIVSNVPRWITDVGMSVFENYSEIQKKSLPFEWLQKVSSCHINNSYTFWETFSH